MQEKGRMMNFGHFCDSQIHYSRRNMLAQSIQHSPVCVLGGRQRSHAVKNNGYALRSYIAKGVTWASLFSSLRFGFLNWKMGCRWKLYSATRKENIIPIVT